MTLGAAGAPKALLAIGAEVECDETYNEKIETDNSKEACVCRDGLL